MSLDLHRQAESLMADADAASLRYDVISAQRLLAEAARLEAQAFDAIPPDRVRTRAIIAVSSVVLYRRAGNLEMATRQAYRYLADAATYDIAGNELRTLLEDIDLERSLAASDLRLEEGQYEWILRGPAAVSGVAQVDVVLQKFAQIERAAIRAFEYVVGAPMRTKGPPLPEIQRSVQLLIGQPVSGSYRFGFRFARSQEQLRMFETAPADSVGSVSSFFSNLLTIAEDPADLEELVPDPAYRGTLARLIRNVGPDGRKLTEVDFVRLDEAGPSRTTRLTKASGRLLDQYIEASRSPSAATLETTDRLRGLNLNDHRISLGEKETEVSYRVSDDVPLEDIAGPLINRRVRVKLAKRGRWLVAEDIEEATDDPAESHEEPVASTPTLL